MLSRKRVLNNIPIMQFRSGIPRNTQSKHICYHWLSVSGVSKIMHCGILINMPYWTRLVALTGYCMSRYIICLLYQSIDSLWPFLRLSVQTLVRGKVLSKRGELFHYFSPSTKTQYCSNWFFLTLLLSIVFSTNERLSYQWSWLESYADLYAFYRGSMP